MNDTTLSECRKKIHMTECAILEIIKELEDVCGIAVGKVIYNVPQGDGRIKERELRLVVEIR